MKERLEKTKSLEEAIKELFGLDLEGRLCILTQEAMNDEVAKAYNQIGSLARLETYHRIVEDFKNRTGCYAVNHLNFDLGNILEVGCGSGLLSLALAKHTAGNIVGVDLSSDMIDLANENLSRRSKERIEKIKGFWKKIPWYCRPGQEEHETLERNPPSLDEVRFRIGSVYDLPEIIRGVSQINYVVCRNALHRFQDPKLAIQKMFEVVAPDGKIYIRDLRRDADWRTVVERIGEERWKRPVLVKDYIGAMASMLTVEEVHSLLRELGISDYHISDGNYQIREKTAQLHGMKEYAGEVEYTCVIHKPLTLIT